MARKLGWSWKVWFGLAVLATLMPGVVCAQSPLTPDSPQTTTPPLGQPPQFPGSITGIVTDPKSAPLVGANVSLTREGKSLGPDVMTGDDGRFTFASVTPGPFQVTISGEGFAAQTASGVLHSSENYQVPDVALAVATAVTEVRVELTPVEIAQEQLTHGTHHLCASLFEEAQVRRGYRPSTGEPVFHQLELVLRQ